MAKNCKQTAIDFLEWQASESWILSSNDLWYQNSDGVPEEGITTEQLYDLFENQYKYNFMNFISTKGMTKETAPKGQVLVQYLEPFFGSFTVCYGIGYFDNPNDYYNGDDGDKGWKLWIGSHKINVVAYCELPEVIKSIHESEKQEDFLNKYGEFPNLGCVGE